MNKYKVADTVLTMLVILIAAAAVIAGIVFTVQWLSSHEEPEDREYKSVKIYGEDQIPSKFTVNKERTLAVYFNALAPFSGMDVICAGAEKNRLEITLYAFDADYATTVAGKKLADVRFTDFEDGASLAVSFGTVPAGEYLAVFSSDRSAEIYCSYYQSETADNSVVVYDNGDLLLNCVPYMSVIFDRTAENGKYFG
ncbi:MAG: hypothetical protein IJL30_04980 [Clostridia bacterium]|nr:hypothetical protein [Clostridia bacterium]